MRIAALVMVSVGTVGLLVIFVLMRRKLDQLRRFKEGRR